jgi:hypothetical protein
VLGAQMQQSATDLQNSRPLSRNPTHPMPGKSIYRRLETPSLF